MPPTNKQRLNLPDLSELTVSELWRLYNRRCEQIVNNREREIKEGCREVERRASRKAENLGTSLGDAIWREIRRRERLERPDEAKAALAKIRARIEEVKAEVSQRKGNGLDVEDQQWALKRLRSDRDALTAELRRFARRAS